MPNSFVMDDVLSDFRARIAGVRGQLKSVMLFGSRARGDHRTDSDYDVLIVTPKKDAALIDALYEAVMDVLLAHGRLISLKIYEEQEFERLLRLHAPFVEMVAREGFPLG
jgi:predicted nucleotidyltransferase